MIINLEQTKDLLECFGGEDAEMVLVESEEGHSGKGLYAYFYDYPEEGAVFLGASMAKSEYENYANEEI